jgi:hypothetical protein
MRYDFLVESYETERTKVLSVWSEFRDEDLPVRPRTDDRRGRSVREHMVHQCMSEDTWFRTMLGIDVGAPPLPRQETRIEFLHSALAMPRHAAQGLCKVCGAYEVVSRNAVFTGLCASRPGGGVDAHLGSTATLEFTCSLDACPSLECISWITFPDLSHLLDSPKKSCYIHA